MFQARIAALAAAWSLASSIAPASTIHVPADQPTIQAAVNVAQPGDRILVAPGTYFETIDVSGKTLSIVGDVGPSSVYIDGSGVGPILRGTGAVVTLKDVNFMNASASEGAGLWFDASTVVLDWCHFSSLSTPPGSKGNGAGTFLRRSALKADRAEWLFNDADGSGAGVRAEDCTLKLERCTFYDQDALQRGGALSLLRCDTRVTGSTFFNCTSNADAAAIEAIDGTLILEQSGIDSCFAYGALALGAAVRVGGTANFTGEGVTCINCRCSRSVHTDAGAFAFLASPAATLKDTIIYQVSPRSIHDPAGRVTVSYSDVEGGFAGVGNINVDPIVDLWPSFGLWSGSACVESGDPAVGPGGVELFGGTRVLDGNLDRTMRVDIGCREFNNVNVTIPEELFPGYAAWMAVGGTKGLPFLLFVGTVPGELILDPFGRLEFDLTSPFLLVAVGVTPWWFTFTVPTGVPSGTTIVAQPLGFGANGAGNLADAVVSRFH